MSIGHIERPMPSATPVTLFCIPRFRPYHLPPTDRRTSPPPDLIPPAGVHPHTSNFTLTYPPNRTLRLSRGSSVVPTVFLRRGLIRRVGRMQWTRPIARIAFA